MILPTDPTPEEKEIYSIMMSRVYQPTDTIHYYQLIDDPINKFLLAWVFEMGRTRRAAQRALGLSKATIWKRVKIIKKVIKVYAENNHLIKYVDKI
jgi:hypothetical protein